MRSENMAWYKRTAKTGTSVTRSQPRSRSSVPIQKKARKRTCKSGSAMNSSKRTPTILWNEELSEFCALSPSKFVQDTTWILNYEHRAFNDTQLFIKAGSKTMALSGIGDSELQLRTSESGLIKKYRYGLDVSFTEA